MHQMTIWDFPEIKTEIKLSIPYQLFYKHCKHGGSTKAIYDDEGNNIGCQKMCSYKNGRSARCWDDWIPCKPENCYLLTERMET